MKEQEPPREISIYEFLGVLDALHESANQQIGIIEGMIEQVKWYENNSDKYRLKFYIDENGVPSYEAIEKRMGFI